MLKGCWEIFGKSFPEIKLTKKQFADILGDVRFIVHENKGFAAVSGDKIRLLCVSPEYRNSGVGIGLLKECEDIIRSGGHDRAILGGTDSQLFIGVPENFSFFEKAGYISDGGCMEKTMRFDGYDAEKLGLRLYPEGITFGFFEGDREELRKSVALVDDEWVQYFDDECPVFCAFEDGKPVGFTIMGYDDLCVLSGEGERVGSIGCVGVMPSVRKRGIGIAMAAHACTILKEIGCTRLFIHYTHLVNWYERLGCKTFLEYKFAEKPF